MILYDITANHYGFNTDKFDGELADDGNGCATV
jgi:hypothetical protein